MPRRLLIADDDPTLRDSLVEAARAAGFAVREAPNGESAWEALQEEPFDLLVTDLMMPRLDGPALMGRVAALSPRPRVIAITGYASLDAAVECLRRGASDFLTKPFDTEAFLAAVARVLDGAGRGHDDPDWAALAARYRISRRQMEVLTAFYRTGKSNRELADALFLSPHTVKSHLKAAFEKLGVSTRAQVLRMLRQMRG